MLKIILPALTVIFFSCHDFHTPDDNEIKQATADLFEKRNGADGGGGWKVKDVKLRKLWKGDDERHYNAEVSIQGVHTSPPLANPKPDEDIDETVTIRLVWHGGKWVSDDQ